MFNFFKRIFPLEQKRENQPPLRQLPIQRQAGECAELPPRRGEAGDDFKGVEPSVQKTFDPPPGLVLDHHVIVMSMLSPQDIKRLNGIPAQAAMAAFTGPKHPPKLHGNPAFMAFFNDFMNRRAISEPGVIRSALEQVEGYLYFIDLNTPDGINGRVPPEDIIGSLKVTGGKLVDGSYQSNPKYCVYREGRGLMQLPEPLHKALYEEMLALPPCPPSKSP
jgi:hypothetical protein